MVSCRPWTSEYWGFDFPLSDYNIIDISINTFAYGYISYAEVQMSKGNTKYTKELIEKFVNKSKSIKDVILHLGLKPNNGNYRNISGKIKIYGISIEHFTRNPTRGKTYENCESIRKTTRRIRWPDEKVFCKNSVSIQGQPLKKRLIFDKGWKDECVICGLKAEWNGKPITLQVDHINGSFNDNRLENLRILCPNCHSQTDTYAGRRNSLEKPNCKTCGKQVGHGNDRCRTCANHETGKKLFGKNTKIDWPPTEELKEMVNKEPYTTVAKRLGVSDNAIRKRIKNHG